MVSLRKSVWTGFSRMLDSPGTSALGTRSATELPEAIDASPIARTLSGPGSALQFRGSLAMSRLAMREASISIRRVVVLQDFRRVQMDEHLQHGQRLRLRRVDDASSGAIPLTAV